MSENHLDMLEESISKPWLKRAYAVLILASLLCFGGTAVQAQDAQGAEIGKEEQAAETITEQSSDTDAERQNVPTPIPAGAGDESEIPSSEEAITAGAALFKNNCAQCHDIQEVVVGPALRNVHQRRDVPWLKAFIKNSQKVIQTGDAYAVNLYNEYNKTQMPSFNFQDEEIMAILAYVKNESENPAATGGSPATALDGQTVTDPDAGSPTSGYLTAILVVLGVVLVLVLIVLGLVLAVLRRYLNQRTDLDEADREIVDRRMSLKGVLSSKPFLFLLIFIFTAVAFKSVIDGLYRIGVQQGYMPTQPIAFSHKLHAGTYNIGCNYCHTGVYKAKSANIPSVNICMNCHNTIKKESVEIQKLYAAIEKEEPIEWVRVHNLPDLAYFNHSQHTNVGGLDCQTCHGPIQEMDVVYQYSKLTMGWCVNCHRETQVKAQDNDYYDKLLLLHENSEVVGEMKVKDIGGLECSRCHY